MPKWLYVPALFAFLLLGGSASPGEAQVRCSNCDEFWENGVRYHRFTEGTECQPEIQFAPQCANCGGTSRCHDQAEEGPCHVGCSPIVISNSAGYMNQVFAAIDRGGLDLEAASHILVRQVLSNNFVRYDSKAALIEIRDCWDRLVVRWEVPALLSSRIQAKITSV